MYTSINCLVINASIIKKINYNCYKIKRRIFSEIDHENNARATFERFGPPPHVHAIIRTDLFQIVTKASFFKRFSIEPIENWACIINEGFILGVLFPTI